MTGLKNVDPTHKHKILSYAGPHTYNSQNMQYVLYSYKQSKQNLVHNLGCRQVLSEFPVDKLCSPGSSQIKCKLLGDEVVGTIALQLPQGSRFKPANWAFCACMGFLQFPYTAQWHVDKANWLLLIAYKCKWLSVFV